MFSIIRLRDVPLEKAMGGGGGGYSKKINISASENQGQKSSSSFLQHKKKGW